MKAIFRKAVVLFISAIMILGLAGCSSGTSSGTSIKVNNNTSGNTSDPSDMSGAPMVRLPEDAGIIEVYELTEDMTAVDETTGEKYVRGMIIIFFAEDASETDKARIISGINGKIAGQIDALDQVQVSVPETGLEEMLLVCDKLNNDPLVDLATYDNIFEEDAYPFYPNDEKYLSWSPEEQSNRNWGLIALSADMAWGYEDLFSTVKVGVVDSGFSYGHADLAGQMSYIEGSTGSVHEHGTHVAGIIGACHNNGTGISGIAPNAKLLTYGLERGLLGGFSDSAIYAGFTAAVQSGAKIVNLSVGGNSLQSLKSRSKAASRAIGKLLKKGYDFLVVQSAGNSGTDALNNGQFCSVTEKYCDTKYASRSDIMDRIIIVGSARRDGDWYIMSDFSCGGSRVDLCAPGTNIYSCVQPSYKAIHTEESAKYFEDDYYLEDGMYDPSQCDDGDEDGAWYAFMSGTSMAAPYVSGIAAMVWGADPGLTGAEVKELLCDKENSPITVPDNPESETTGNFRMVNAFYPVQAALINAGKVNKDGSRKDNQVSGDENVWVIPMETDAEGSETHVESDSGHAQRCAVFKEFMENAIQGGGFYQIAPNWMYVDNSYFNTSYLSGFGLADTDFDGEDELVLMVNQMSQESTVYVYEADPEYGECVLGEQSHNYPTISENVSLFYYSNGQSELADYSSGYSHFALDPGYSWDSYPELGITGSDFAPRYVSISSEPRGDTYTILTDDGPGFIRKELGSAETQSLLDSLRKGEKTNVTLYKVTQENISQILR